MRSQGITLYLIVSHCISLYLIVSHCALLACSRSRYFSATLDCTGGIISVGDSRVDVLSKCSEPDRKESHDEEISEKLNQGGQTITVHNSRGLDIQFRSQVHARRHDP